MAGHRCCPEPCDKEPGGPCSCDCEDCVECCWAVGDKITYRHSWETYELQRTTPPNSPFIGPLCWRQEFYGGEVEVDYTMLFCGNLPEGFAVVFAIDTASQKGISYNKATGFYEKAAGRGAYPLFPRLVLFCGTGDGDRVWAGASITLNELYDLTPCVAACNDCVGVGTGSITCQCAGYTQFESDPCNAGAGGFTSQSPCWCEECVERVDECGGVIAYCLHADKSQECACTGNFYSNYSDPITSVQSCGFGCEEEAGSANITFFKDYCAVRSVDVLEIAPKVGTDRDCRWWEDEECCQKKKLCPTGECSDVLEPQLAEPDYPLLPPGDCPDGYPGGCDCNSVVGDYVDTCAPPEEERDGCGGNGFLVIGNCT
jgi:hypothetical protein